MTDRTSISNDSKRLGNPFTPEFGKVPVYMAGRTLLIEEMVRALDSGRNDPNLCTLFVGARGTGKTAMLSFLSNEAERLGWISANVTSTPGMLEDIIQRLQEAASHLIVPESKRRIDGIEVGGILGCSWQNEGASDPNWRSRMNAVFEGLSSTDTGVLITVDEVDAGLDEMVHLVTTYQHFVREGKKVALLMAGLPHSIFALLSGKSTSFLRRASRHDLGMLPDYEIEEAFRLTVEDGGRMVDAAAVEEAVECIGGFPFMFQLVGYRAWNASAGEVISLDDVRSAARLASKEMKAKIFDATYGALSKNDRAFLNAMLESRGPATREELMQRLGKSTSHVSTYKKRLLESGVIEETVVGSFVFALPGFREYLLENSSMG